MKTGLARDGAFSRTDLLLVASLLLLLFSLGPRLRGDFKSQSKTAVCLGNHQQLIAGWLMYADSNQGKLVHNAYGGTVQAPSDEYRPWVYGWLDWTDRSDNTNTVNLTDSHFSALAEYVGRNPRLFKCPEDAYLSPVQKDLHWKERVRSYGMNNYVGTEPQRLDFPAAAGQIHSSNLVQIARPDRIFVFAEEHPGSIGDGNFWATHPNEPTWIELPGAFHNSSTVLSFSDGHADAHRWENRRGSIRPVGFSDVGMVETSVIDPDFLWMKERSFEPAVQP